MIRNNVLPVPVHILKTTRCTRTWDYGNAIALAFSRRTLGPLVPWKGGFRGEVGAPTPTSHPHFRKTDRSDVDVRIIHISLSIDWTRRPRYFLHSSADDSYKEKWHFTFSPPRSFCIVSVWPTECKGHPSFSKGSKGKKRITQSIG